MKLQSFTQVCVALAVSAATCAFSQPAVKLEHDSSWELMGRQCTIRVLQLANLSAEDTGPLYLGVYARSGVGWDGVGSPGILVARAPIGGLGANVTSNNILVTAKARPVPSGEKFTALLVERKEGRKFIPIDYVIYTSTYTFPRGQSGGVGSDDFAIGDGDVTISGVVSLGGQKRRAEYFIERIQNRRELNTTGLLRLAIYATPEPFDGSTIGSVVAARPLGQLAQGDFYHLLRGKLAMKRPGRGLFYLTLAIEEDQGSGFQRVAHVAVPDAREF